MRGFLALVVHEINQRKALLAAAAVASLLPLAAPLLPATGSTPPEDVREAVMWFVVATLIPVFAILLGATFIGRDLAEGRLGFYFAQPMSAPAIWFAKLVSAMLLIGAAQVLLMLPTAVLSGEPMGVLARTLAPDPTDGGWMSFVIVWIGPMVLILVAHALGLAWRARSAWLILDLLAAAIAIAATRLVMAPFLRVFAADAVIAVAVWVLVAAIVGLTGAGAAQLSVGRTDAARGHRAFSAAFWGWAGIAIVAAAGWGLWVRSATPDDLDRIHAISLGAGDWIGLTGESTGRFDYYPGFLINVVDGRWIRAHAGSDVHERGTRFSADGTMALWAVPAGSTEARLMTVDLSGEVLQPRRSGVVVTRFWRDLELSDGGERVAIIEDDTVLVHDVATGVLTAAARVSGGFSPVAIQFRGPGVVLVLALKREPSPANPSVSSSRWKRHVFDVDAGTLDDGQEIVSTWGWREPDWTNSRGLTLERSRADGDDVLRLVDPAAGATVAELGETPKNWLNVRISAGERIALLRDGDERSELEVFAPDGGLVHRIALPGSWLRCAGEVLPDVLVIGSTEWSSDGGTPAERSTIVVDLAAGAIRERIKGYSPVLGGWRFETSTGAWEAGSTASRLMTGRGFTLHLWDPETGDLRQIIPRTG